MNKQLTIEVENPTDAHYYDLIEVAKQEKWFN